MKFDVLHNGQVVETKELGEGSHKVGRAADCAITLRSPQVSKQHAMIVIKGNKAAILDLGSVNGVFLNGILIRKQRVNKGDEISIGDFKVRLSQPGRTAIGRGPQSSSPSMGGEPMFDGNLALDPMSAQMMGSIPVPESNIESEKESSPQEKILMLMDEKVFGFFFELNKSIDWRPMLAGIMGAGILLTVFASVFSLLDWGLQTATTESLDRGQTIVSQAVRENYRIITETGELSRLTVEAIEKERGIVKAVIVDPLTKTVLAPIDLGRDPVTNVYEQIALDDIILANADISAHEIRSGLWVLAQPLYVYPKDGKRDLKGVVLVRFQIPDRVTQTYEPIVTALLISVLVGMICFLLLQKIISHPISQVQEQLDLALKGEGDTIACAAKFPELEALAQQINFAVSRFQQAEEKASADISVENTQEEDARYAASIREMDVATSDGIFLLDREKKIKFVGHVTESLLSMNNDYAYGQNVSDACKDGTLAGTLIDLAENVVTSFGETQEAQLSVNGINREVCAVGHKNSTGEIAYILIIIKIMSVDD